MKKKMVKNVLAMALGTMIAATAALTPVSAMADSSYVSASLNGYSCTGSISVNFQSATAVTTFSRGNSKIFATAIVYCYKGTKKVSYKSGPASSTAGGTSATAYKITSEEEVYAGRGIHQAGYDSFKWGPVETFIERY
ncbi:MAG: hypothetical protein SPL57_06430 [Lachnospiraceae bacterium]|nr:hypothetical protein [Lachnospiraceae bacterium]